MQRSAPNNEATNMRGNKECTKQHKEAAQGGSVRRQQGGSKEVTQRCNNKTRSKGKKQKGKKK